MEPSIIIPLHVQLAVAHVAGGLGPGEEATVGIDDEVIPGLSCRRLLPSLIRASEAGIIKLLQEGETITVALKNKNP